MSKQLFELSYEQRRRNFVETRFSEKASFGRKDVGAWLIKQKAALRPDVESWQTYLAKDYLALAAGDRVLRLLPNLARRINDFFVPEGGDATQVWQNTSDLRLALDQRMAVLYELPNGFVIATAQHSHLSALACTGNFMTSQMTLEPLGSFRLAEAALLSWHRGSSTAMKARNFLCKALAEVIRQERQRAEADFDQAVACSAAGRQIIHARLVIVDKGLGQLNFAPTAFHGEKILLDGLCSYSRSQETLRALEACCPSPLPPGGEWMTLG